MFKRKSKAVNPPKASTEPPAKGGWSKKERRRQPTGDKVAVPLRVARSKAAQRLRT